MKIAVGVCAAVVALAPVAAADPSVPFGPNDTQFLKGMAQLGIVGTPYEMISEAHWICTSLTNGDTVGDLQSKIRADNPAFSERQVNGLIGESVFFYCQYNQPKLAGY
jgi:hypothetical protein